MHDDDRENELRRIRRTLETIIAILVLAAVVWGGSALIKHNKIEKAKRDAEVRCLTGEEYPNHWCEPDAYKDLLDR